MSIAKSVAQATAAAAAAMALSCAMAQAAFAVQPYPVATALSPEDVNGAIAQPSSSDDTQNRVSVNIVDFLGNPGETVFISATIGKDQKEEPIANFYPYTLGEDTGAAADADVSADAFAIEVARGELERMVEDGIHVVVYDSRAGGKALGSYDVRGVYAQFLDADGKEVATTLTLIGTCTDGATFTASENLAHDNKMYRLDGNATATAADENIVFTYRQYDPQSTIDGVVRYVDIKTGETLKYTTSISGLAKNESRTVTLPNSIREGKYVYCPLSFVTEVTAENPGATSFSVPVFALGQDEADVSDKVNISLVAGDEVIAADAVFVKSGIPVVYTAPQTIYKTRTVGEGADKERVVYTYTLKGSPTYTFGSNDIDTTKTFNYEQQSIDAPEVEVTFNLQNGQKRVGSKERNLGVEKATVSKDSKTAQPTKDTIEVDGATYKMVGQASDYAYTYGSGEVPVVDVYYVPEDYVADGPYEVTVNYVNFYDRSIIDSETFESSPDQLGNMEFTAPERFTAKGVEWVRLDGQDASISHSYYAKKYEGRTTYTVYYRDSSQQLEQAPVITQIVAAPAAATTTTTTNTDNTPADAATAAAALRDGQVYNVAEGQGVSQAATAQDGREALQERIEDDEVALSDGLDAAADASDDAAEQGVPGWLVPLIGVVVAALVAGLAAFFVVRRRNDEDEA